MSKRGRISPSAIEQLEPRIAPSAGTLPHGIAGHADLQVARARTSPGAVTTAFYDAIWMNVLNDAEGRLNYVATLSGGKVDVSPLISDIEGLTQQILIAEAPIRQVRDNPGGHVLLGYADGRKLVLDRKGLARLDHAVYVAAQDQLAAGVGAVAGARAAYATHSPAAIASFDTASEIPLVQDAANAITQWAPAQIIKGGTAARNGFSALFGGPTTPPGALVYAEITQLTYVIANSVEAGAKSIISSNTNLRVSSESQASQFLLDSYSNGLGTSIMNAYNAARRAPQDFAALIAGLKNSAVAIGAQLNPNNPGSVIARINQYLAAPSSTPTPTPSPSPLPPIFYPTPSPSPSPSPTPTPSPSPTSYDPDDDDDDDSGLTGY